MDDNNRAVPQVPNAGKPAQHQWHPSLEKDVNFFFKASQSSDSRKLLRHEIATNFRASLMKLPTNSDSKFEVHDLSFPFAGASDFENYPIELAIVDTAHLEGLPPTHGDAPLPIPYDALELARHLALHGYSGTFVDMQPDYTGAPKYPLSSSQSKEGSEDEPLLFIPEVPWGALEASDGVHDFVPFNTLYPVLPPSLRVTTVERGGTRESLNPELILHPVHPSYVIRHLIIRSWMERSDFQFLMSTLWVWTRSWNLTHFMPSTCAFIVAAYLQSIGRLPPQCNNRLKSADADRTDLSKGAGFWVRQPRSESRTLDYYRQDVPPISSIPYWKRRESSGTLIYNLLEFLGSIEPTTGGPQIYTLSLGGTKPRERPYSRSALDRGKIALPKWLTERALLDEKGEKYKLSSCQNPVWHYQPLIIEDPIVPLHNAAHLVTRSALRTVRIKANTVATRLRKGSPATEIFGPLLLLEAHSTESVFSNHEFVKFPPVSPLIHQLRAMTIGRVHDVLRRKYTKQYTVECFGSTRYGVDIESSDLDLVIVDSQRPSGFVLEDEKLPGIYNVHSVARTLRDNGFRVTAVVPFATVPIVKFIDPQTQMHCDINTNDQLGLFNTRLIARYCELLECLPNLLLAIKKWAKSFGLNNPSGHGGAVSFSSYALTLMTIGYLQIIDVLPNLQAELEPLDSTQIQESDAVFWLRARAGPPIPCDRRFNRLDGWQAPQDTAQDTRTLLTGWFRYWGTQHLYSAQLMSIRDGGVVQRALRPEKMNDKVDNKEMDEKEKDKNGITGNKDHGEENKENLGCVDRAIPNVPDVPEADAADEGTAADSAEVDIVNGKQPKRWGSSILIVADPFILTKNVTGNVYRKVVDRFKADCQRALFLLEHNCTYEDLLGDDAPLIMQGKGKRFGHPAKQRPRHQNDSGKPDMSIRKTVASKANHDDQSPPRSHAAAN